MRLDNIFENDDEHYDAMEKTGFWGKRAAGAILFAEDTKRFLIAHRSRAVLEPGTYGSVGGAIDAKEVPLEAVKREIAEELGFNGPFTGAKELYVFTKGTFQYTNFVFGVPKEIPAESFRLNWENDGVAWVTLAQLVSMADTPKLHYGLKSVLADPAAFAMLKGLAMMKESFTEAVDPEQDYLFQVLDSLNFTAEKMRGISLAAGVVNGMSGDEKFDYFNDYIIPIIERHRLPVQNTPGWLAMQDDIKRLLLDKKHGAAIAKGRLAEAGTMLKGMMKESLVPDAKKQRFRLGDSHIDYSLVAPDDPEPVHGMVYIDMIFTPTGSRGKGEAKKVLAAFLKETDKLGKSVCLYPVGEAWPLRRCRSR